MTHLTVDWQAKLLASLWTPPFAALWDSAGDSTTDRAAFLGLIERELAIPSEASQPTGSLGGIAAIANDLARAADQPKLSSPMPERLTFLHPFETAAERGSAGHGSTDDLVIADVRDEVILATSAVVAKLLADHAGDPQRQFLALWRLLPMRLTKDEPIIGARWRQMPVDARISGSVWGQSALASAIAGAGNDPAILIFTIAGVQEFIGAARRTIDLWAGSYLLSWLMWAALRTVIRELGPDAVLSPALRDQPLVDKLLIDEFSIDVTAPSREDLEIANLPNVATIVVPAQTAVFWGERLAAEVRKERDAIFEAVATGMPANLRDLMHALEPGLPANDKTASALAVPPLDQPLADVQIGALLESEIFWASCRWAELSLAERKDVEAGASPTFATLHALADSDRNVAFPVRNAQAAQAMTSRKNLRQFRQQDLANRGTCTVCGVRAAIVPPLKNVPSRHDGLPPLHDVTTWWEALERFSAGQVRSQERLCAVCLLRRWSYRSYLRAQLGGGPDDTHAGSHFPSTSSIAAGPFKLAVFAKWDTLKDSVAGLVAAIQALDPGGAARWSTHRAFMAPLVERAAKRLMESMDAGADRALVESFLRLDGDWLARSTYDPDVLKRAYPLLMRPANRLGVAEWSLADTAGKAAEALERLTADAVQEGIRRPSRYLAALVGDGDHAGKWIIGEYNPTFGELLHPDITESGTWIDHQRPLGPASQSALTSALSGFALKSVRDCVERRYPGVLVYAGGDDVVALAPLGWDSSVTDVVETDPIPTVLALGEQLATAFRAPELTLNSGETVFGLGNRASLSLAISIVSVSETLSRAIRTASADLKGYAKKLLHRDALSIRIEKRSGESFRTGAKWRVPGLARPPVKILGDLLVALRGGDAAVHGEISTRLVHDVARRRRPYAGVLASSDPAVRALATADLRRLAGRRLKPAGDVTTVAPEVPRSDVGSQHDNRGVDGTVTEFFESLVAMERLIAGQQVAAGEAGGTSVPPTAPEIAWQRLAELLEAAEFIQREA